MRMALAHDRPPITGYDQDAWADRLRYGEADASESIGVHSERGEESVGHMMKLYAGHDLLHINQIHRIRAAVGR
jgi:hypothetical protein